jgi:hypothetical protein
MSLTRRRFVQGASLSLLAGTSIPAVLAQAVSGAKDAAFDPENLSAFSGISIRTFEPLVGETFAVTSGHAGHPALTLISVKEVVPPSPEAHPLPMVGRVPQPSRQPLTGFTLRFVGSGPDLQQDTYTLQNRSIGSISLLLVPSGPGTAPATYTAVFNLLG